MKKLRYKMPITNIHSRYVDDIERIKKVYSDRGYEISSQDAMFAWEDYSDTYAAGWLIMNPYTDQEIFDNTFVDFEEE